MQNHWTAKFSRDQIKELLMVKGATFENRVSDLLIDQLHYGIITSTVHSHKVIDEIVRLERAQRGPTGDVEPFKGDVLRGFWKKHYFQSNFIGRNLLNEFKMENPNSRKFEELCRRIGKSSKDRQHFSALLAHEFTVGAFEKRAKKGKLRGEWIVFKKHEEKNYYLSLAFHKEADEAIRDRIRDNCYKQFPFLS